jgi:hypothetical protein
MIRTHWRRITRRNPCPICGRPDWCLIATDGSACICPRVQSDRRAGEAGWYHRLRDDRYPGRRPPPPPPKATPTARPDLARLAERYRQDVDPGRLYQFAASLGLSTRSLEALDIGWSAWHQAWAFPMRDASGGVLGIRLRKPDGSKFAVRGGHEGLFLPAGWAADPEHQRLLIGEGPTDVAALRDMGLVGVVGRPSCTGGVALLTALVRQQRPREVVIVADADLPGQQGAQRLAGVLIGNGQTVRVLVPPTGIKDARAWLRAGGTRADLERAIGQVPSRRLAPGQSGRRGHHPVVIYRFEAAL